MQFDGRPTNARHAYDRECPVCASKGGDEQAPNTSTGGWCTVLYGSGTWQGRAASEGTNAHLAPAAGTVRMKALIEAPQLALVPKPVHGCKGQACEQEELSVLGCAAQTILPDPTGCGMAWKAAQTAPAQGQSSRDLSNRPPLPPPCRRATLPATTQSSSSPAKGRWQTPSGFRVEGKLNKAQAYRQPVHRGQLHQAPLALLEPDGAARAFEEEAGSGGGTAHWLWSTALKPSPALVGSAPR
jgi:hypothetical protein